MNLISVENERTSKADIGLASQTNAPETRHIQTLAEFRQVAPFRGSNVVFVEELAKTIIKFCRHRHGGTCWLWYYLWPEDIFNEDGAQGYLLCATETICIRCEHIPQDTFSDTFETIIGAELVITKRLSDRPDHHGTLHDFLDHFLGCFALDVFGELIPRQFGTALSRILHLVLVFVKLVLQQGPVIRLEDVIFPVVLWKSGIHLGQSFTQITQIAVGQFSRACI